MKYISKDKCLKTARLKRKEQQQKLVQNLLEIHLWRVHRCLGFSRFWHKELGNCMIVVSKI